MSEDYEVLTNWREERTKTISELRVLGDELECAHKDKAKTESNTAKASLLGDIIGLSGVLLAPVSGGASLAATVFTSTAGIGSLAFRYRANQNDKNITTDIQQKLSQRLKEDNKAAAKIQVLMRDMNFLKDQLYILQIDKIVVSLQVRSFAGLETNMEDIRQMMHVFSERLNLSDISVSSEVLNLSKELLMLLQNASSAKRLVGAWEFGHLMPIDEIVTTAKDAIDMTQSAKSINEAKTLTSVIFNELGTAETVAVAATNVAKKVIAVSETVQSAKEASVATKTVGNIVKNIAETVLSTKETSGGMKMVATVVKEAIDISEKIQTVKEGSVIVKTATELMKEVKDISATVQPMKGASEAVKIVKEVKDMSKTVKSIKEASDTVNVMGKVAKEVVSNSETMKSATSVVKEVIELSESVKSTKEATHAFKTATHFIKEVKEISKSTQSVKEASVALRTGTNFVKEVKDVSETVINMKKTSDTVKTATNIVKDIKDISETVQSTKKASDAVKTATTIVNEVKGMSATVQYVKETSEAARSVTNVIKDVKGISDTVQSVKESSDTIKTAATIVKEMKDVSETVKTAKEASEAAKSVTNVIKDVKGISDAVKSVKESTDTVKTAATLVKEMKDVSETVKSAQEASEAVKSVTNVIKDVKGISETVKSVKESSDAVKTAAASVTETGKAIKTLSATAKETESSLKSLRAVKQVSDTAKTASGVAKDSNAVIQTSNIASSASGANSISKTATTAASVSKFGLAMSAVFIPLDIYNVCQAEKGLNQSYDDVEKIKADAECLQNQMETITDSLRAQYSSLQKLCRVLSQLYEDHRIEQIYEYLILLHDKLELNIIPRLKDERIWSENREPIPVQNSLYSERGSNQFCRKMSSSEIFTPPDWTSISSDKSVNHLKISGDEFPVYDLVKVDDITFRSVESLVQSTWEKFGEGRDATGLRDLGVTSLKVTGVRRIENLTLYEQYCQRRQGVFLKAAKSTHVHRKERTLVDDYLNHMWKRCLYDEVNEGYFFHGTKSDAVQSVLKQGLDPRMSNGRSALGRGIYMAESSTKADQYTDDKGNRQREGLQMFLVRACLGHTFYTEECERFRRPPCCVERCFGDACDHGDRFDSVVLDKFIFREFVVYESQLTYPEYLITYDRVE